MSENSSPSSTRPGQDDLLRQKERFCAGLPVDGTIVRDMILRSWTRSRRYGISPDHASTLKLDANLLQHLCAHHGDLIACTREVFHNMFPESGLTASSMVLANAEGIILASFLPRSENGELPAAELGALSRENVIGTNGIGTCLEEQRPLEIIGAEHFRHMGESWSCSAAPIFDEQRRLVAVLNVSQRREHYHGHTLGMVKAAAYAISEQLRLSTLLRRQETIMGLLDDGILALGRNGDIRMMNANAASLLGLDAPRHGEPIANYIHHSPLLQSILQASVPAHDKEARFDFVSGARGCLYSVLPISDTDGIILVLREAQRMRKIAVKLTGNRATYTFSSILGHSPAIREAVQEAQKIASRPTTVLLLGESGTGKELFAHAIHNASARSSGPFISVNCGALPRSLLESELFGYEYGAFTGAGKSGKPGKFELASGGTIFLDEIGEMPLDAQVALLRLLQESDVTRIGGTISRRTDVRVLAATNKNLEQMVQDGTFREDLFYRLNVYPVFIPPLRERRGDITWLARHFLSQAAHGAGKPPLSLSAEILELMERYSWPGNVRELENVMERMANIASGETLSPADLPPSLLKKFPISPAVSSPAASSGGHAGEAETAARLPDGKGRPAPAPLLLTPPAGAPAPDPDGRPDRTASPPEFSGYMAEREAEFIRVVLRRNGGNMRKSAQELKLSRPYLYQKCRALRIDIQSIRNAKA